MASWMHHHNCRCSQQLLLILLLSPRALWFAPGKLGSIWKYLGVFGRFACGFRTDLHFADEDPIVYFSCWISDCKCQHHLYLHLYPNIQYQTDWLQMTGQLELHVACSGMPPDLSGVECVGWLLLIQFWHKANSIFLRTFHVILLTSSSPFRHQIIISPGSIHQEATRSELCRSIDASSNASPCEIQQQCR
jgi:hypothetical protein